MVSAFRGVIAPAVDEETIAVVTPEPTTGLNDAPTKMAFCFMPIRTALMLAQPAGADCPLN